MASPTCSESSHLSSETHTDDLIAGLKDLWNENLLCDCTLVAGGESFQVHRVVMAACSPYFRAMFCGQMKESKESRVELKGITAGALRSLVNFAYTGELELCMETMEEVVSAAWYCQLSEAEFLCKDFIDSKLDKENCVDILNMADKYSLQMLQEDTNDLIKKEFQNLSEEVFVKLSGRHLTDLIATNSLCIASEYQLFEKVMLWIRENSDATEETVHDILSQVRFPLMCREELLRASQTEVMTSWPKCQALISEAQEYHKDVLKQPLMQSERTQVRSDVRSYILSANNTMYVMNERKGQVLQKCKLKKIYLWDSVYSTDHLSLEHMAVVDNYLYVCHGVWCDYSLTYFHRYDPRFDEWLQLPTLTMQREYLVLVPYKKSIFAVGIVEEEEDDGFEGLLEFFSIEQNKWLTGASVKPIGSHFAGVACQDNIYVSGGHFCNQSAVRDVSCYTPSTNTWESKAPMIHTRASHEMAELDDVIYVFGGNEEGSVESYLPNSDQWTVCRKRLSFRVLGHVGDENISILTDYGPGSEGGVYLYKYCPGTEETAVASSAHLTLDLFFNITCAHLPLTFWPNRRGRRN